MLAPLGDRGDGERNQKLSCKLDDIRENGGIIHLRQVNMETLVTAGGAAGFIEIMRHVRADEQHVSRLKGKFPVFRNQHSSAAVAV